MNTLNAPDVSAIGLPATNALNLFFLSGVNVNSAAADVATFTGLPARYQIMSLTAYAASVSLTLATLSLYTGAGGTGTGAVVAFALAPLSANTKLVDCTLAVTADVFTAATLYVRNVLAQGAAATIRLALQIKPLP